MASPRAPFAPLRKRPLSEFDIVHDVSGSKGRYVITHPEGESELTYSVMSPTLVIADHTVVAEGYEGQGIGLKLVERLLEDAREKGFKILPLCPFVNAQRRKHPEWADLFSG